jgi:hypothetical protein
MEPSPLFFKPGKKIHNSQFFRNYWCSDYDLCLSRAAKDDLFLDCTQCFMRNDMEDLFLPFLKNSDPD